MGIIMFLSRKVISLSTPLVQVSLVLLVFCSTQTSRAETESTLAENEYSFEASPPAALERLWRERQHAMEVGAFALAKEKLGLLVLAKEVSGWPGLSFFAQSLVHEAEEYFTAQRFSDCQEVLAAAQSLAPNLGPIYWLKLKLGWATNDSYTNLLATLGQIVQLHWRDALYRKVLLNLLFLVFSLALFLTIVALTLALIYRHALLVTHDIAYLLPQRGSKVAATALVFALFILPLVMHLGLAWTIMVWLVELGIYFAWPQRFVAMGILALLGLWVLSLDFGLSAYRYAGSEAENVYFLANDLGPNISRHNSTLTDTPAQSYAKGLRAYWSGSYSEAGRRLEQAELLGSKDATLYILLGNIRFYEEEFLDAIDFYNTAAVLDPDNVLVYFNRARALHKLARFEEGLASHLQAVDLNPTMSKRLRDHTQRYSRVPATTTMIPAELLDLPWQYRGNAFAGLIWTWLGGDKTKRSYFFATGIAILTLLLLAFLRTLIRPAHQCKRCGVVISPRTEVSLPRKARRCGRCYKVFSAISKVSSQQRIDYEKAILGLEHKRQRKMRFMSILLPGTGHMLRDSYLKGGLALLFFLFTLLSAVSLLAGFPKPLPLWQAKWIIEGAAALLISVIFYVTFLLQSRKRGRRGA